MATLADLRTRIAERLKDPSFQTISAASVNLVINQTLHYYKYRRFWFNDSEVDITLNVGDPLVPNIPADLLTELPTGGLVINYSTVFYKIEKRSGDIYDQENVSGVGLPYIYCYRDQNYYLYFYPNIAYTLKFRYIHDYADLVNDSDNNDFTNNCDMMMMYNALSRIYGEYKQDPTMEKYYTSRADDEEKNINRRSDILNGSGTLTLDSYLLM